MNEVLGNRPSVEELLNRLLNGPISFKYKGIGYTINLGETESGESIFVVKESFKEFFSCIPKDLFDYLDEYFPGVEVDFESAIMNPYTLKLPTEELDAGPTLDVPSADDSVSDIIASVIKRKDKI